MQSSSPTDTFLLPNQGNLSNFGFNAYHKKPKATNSHKDGMDIFLETKNFQHKNLSGNNYSYL